jgi:hypothetical protein
VFFQNKSKEKSKILKILCDFKVFIAKKKVTINVVFRKKVCPKIGIKKLFELYFLKSVLRDDHTY